MCIVMLGGVFYKCLIRLLNSFSSFLFLCDLPSDFCSINESWLLKFPNIIVKVYILPSILSVLLLCIFWNSVVRYVYVHYFYIFLMSWSFLNYISFFLSIVTIIAFIPILFDISIVTRTLFWFVFAWTVFLLW